ncbi:response regulator [Rhizobium cauense]|uniref:response regulator n=1 Tax=Rhizobium cauense TaxID=1166683 RepID=UPI001CB79E49|nr:response regulator transcription factor [Rhizobium cauense]
MQSAISVIVADDHSLFRMGVIQAFAAAGGIKVVGEGASKEEAIALTEERQPDVILLDISMPGSGIEAAREIRARWPAVKIVMLTVSEEDDDVLEALEAGATGYLLKGSMAPDLISAVQSVAAGRSYLSSNVGMRLYDVLRNVSESRKTDSLIGKLSTKEAAVFALIGKGHTNRQIAEATGVQVKTVKFHVSRLLSKLGLRNRVEIALLAQQSGVGKTARG